ncbi:FecCD family ABC transporter permease [Agreia sp. Leaf210]|uniref:FecCD family ABC transporter permease n=1 Tax=Agreia sp. Leaf210 TaxID=1735682 RepID=UPI0006F60FFD|nr:iron ABC transporter permease [Agreia sp. Leaf210]KQM59233.1 ABC transporter permease [Agreia sp. Leaf210]
MLIVGLLAAVVLVATVSVSVGTVAIAPDAVWSVIAAHLTGATGLGPPAADQIVWSVRLPRTLLGILVGAALAVAGAVIQAVVRNPLGDPYLIGIVPGAGLGAVIVIVLGSGAVGGLSITAAAFVGAMAAFVATFALGRQQGRWPAVRLVLAGVAIGYLISAFTYFLQTVATPGQLQRVLFWTLGSVSGATWQDLPILAVVVAGGMVWLVANGRRLNGLAGGAELASSLGINVGRFQLQLMALVALMTGAVVAVVGGIGFVGLIIPHLARLLVGADHRRVLVVSLLGGAIFLPLADIVARVLLPPTEIPIGIVTAAVGAPFFIWLLAALGRSGARA